MTGTIDHKAIATELGRFIEGFFLESQYREALSAKAAEFVHGFSDQARREPVRPVAGEVGGTT